MSPKALSRRALIFGHGFSGAAFAQTLLSDGWTVFATARASDKRAALEASGIAALDPAALGASEAFQTRFDAVLITCAPTGDGCPGLAALAPHLRAAPGWIGYLSTTGVYGDRGGGWVDETSELVPSSVEGMRRAAAESAWRALAAECGAPAAIFRLPGLYGPGRSAFERLDAAKQVVKSGQVFSRIHVEDLARALFASLARPDRPGTYNVCDDLPCPPQAVLAYAAKLAGRAPPPQVTLDDPDVRPMTRRFYAENKRVSNAKIKAALGWRPRYPTYKQGLEAIFRASLLTGGASGSTTPAV